MVTAVVGGCPYHQHCPIPKIIHHHQFFVGSFHLDHDFFDMCTSVVPFLSVIMCLYIDISAGHSVSCDLNIFFFSIGHHLP